MKKLPILKMGLLIITAFMLSSCASMFGDNDRTVRVTSTPAGAKVIYNGNYVGKTPTTITVDNPMDSNYVQISKPGYNGQTAEINSNFQMVGILNILFWPGFIIDAATGDMMKVQHTSNILLDKNSASA